MVLRFEEKGVANGQQTNIVTRKQDLGVCGYDRLPMAMYNGEYVIENRIYLLSDSICVDKARPWMNVAITELFGRPINDLC